MNSIRLAGAGRGFFITDKFTGWGLLKGGPFSFFSGGAVGFVDGRLDIRDVMRTCLQAFKAVEPWRDLFVPNGWLQSCRRILRSPQGSL